MADDMNHPDNDVVVNESTWTRNKTLGVIGGVVLAAILLALGYYVGYDIGEERGNGDVNVTVNTFDECRTAGYTVTGNNPRQCRTPEGRVFVEANTNGDDDDDNGDNDGDTDDDDDDTTSNNNAGPLDPMIRLTNPKANQTVSSPLKVTGQARGTWYFEASFPVHILDANGKELGVVPAQAKGDWMTENFVPFEANITFSKSTTPTGTLVLEKDNPSGLPQNADERRIPIKFSAAAQQKATITVKAFFNNNRLDPEISCTRVFAVDREVPNTQAVARAAIEELLKGPTADEQTNNYSTSINTGVVIKNLTITNGVARIDFNSRFNEQVGGSCRVTAIRAQIENTLKQFPSVQQVVISVDGETEGVLEP